MELIEISLAVSEEKSFTNVDRQLTRAILPRSLNTLTRRMS